ncbi:hypothetical protein K3M67_03090 [Sphingobium sp. V4]|uniref:hypothetical protein n=1 Tax=Sphingobium sp. V4 TaxID=3038927 RepID=UPI00255832D4|nr:hypothetical protein [Sphingobium sp. V4]WIW88982.1 hypothetical protein K3M67_03090 [Sphingobium sp. V4]
MSWETITNIAPAKAAAIPPMGVGVACRKLGTRKRGEVRYIRITIAPALAAKLCLRTDKIGLRLALGSGPHAGKIALSVDASNGNFMAKKVKDGGYFLTINAASAAGLFSLDFPSFGAVAEMLPPERDKPPMAAFRASAEMLEAE